MPTVTAKYLGDLRIECEHVQSGVKLITDAPVDNHGKGQAFSPTDLCSTSLGACAMTIMGIYAMNNKIDITGARMEITKTMSANPRRIAQVEVVFHMPDKPYTQAEKEALEKAMADCPVCLSLNQELRRVFKFVWQS